MGCCQDDKMSWLEIIGVCLVLLAIGAGIWLVGRIVGL